ncbi:MAG: UDP-N-acetylmuramoyl-L-alanine--D-glutamate ligase [Gammaproteobacteria bacterium]|nr:UDP-N-acetylmuramoyl-L-alanine--D-glutamate ligase [Gammaproteobacteria bacterium]
MTLGLGKNPLIVGLGKTGLSCIAFLREQGRFYHALDSRSDSPERKDIMADDLCRSLTLNGLEGSFEFHQQRLADLSISSIIVSPGVAVTGDFFFAAKAAGIDILGDVELFARVVSQQSNAKVIAITGSNGKSTVTQLVYELLNEAGFDVSVGGNIGLPVLELLKQPTQYYVLELSSFQLETTYSLKPVIATVLNISEDHMDRYESLEHYAITKFALLKMADAQLVDIDELPELLEGFPTALTLSMSKQTNTDVTVALESRQIHWLTEDDEIIIDTTKLRIPGLHNIRNVVTSLLLCRAVGMQLSSRLIDYLYAWPGLTHRCAFVAEINGISYYNDSKATNVGATQAALNGFAETSDGQIVLIAGGEGKDADFSPLKSVFKKYLRALVLLGRDAELILKQAGQDIPSYIVTSMSEAVEKASLLARPGDQVLLSPACASFDMYRGFEHRGEEFQACVEVLR